MYVDRGQWLRNLQGAALGAADLFGQVKKREAATQLNSTLVQLDRGYAEFLRGLEKEPDFGSYESRFEQYSDQLYRDLSEGISNTGAQRQFDMAWESTREKRRQDVAAMSDRASRVVGRQRLETDLDDLIATGPTTQQTPGEYVESAGAKMASMINSAVMNGVIDEGTATELRRSYDGRFKYNYARDLAEHSVRRLVDSGLSPEETSDILDQAIRLDGEQYEQFIETLGDRVRDPELKEAADAYRMIGLDPELEERLVREMRNEAVVVAGRRQTQRAEAKTEFQNTLVQMWTDPDEIRNLYKNDFAPILDSDLLSPAEKLSWTDKVRSFIDYENAQVRRAQKEREDAEYAELVRTYSVELESLGDDPSEKILEKFEDRVTSDSMLQETDRRYYRIQIDAIRTDEQRRLAQEEARKAAEDEERQKAEEALRKAEEEAVRNQQHLNEWRDARAKLNSGVLTDQMVNSYDTFDEGDLTHWYSQIDRQEKEKEAAAGTVVSNPWKTDPSLEGHVLSVFYNREKTEKEVEDLIMQAMGRGLSPDDAQKWLARLKDRDSQYLRDPVITQAYNVIQSFFDSQFFEDMSETERVEVAAEYSAAMSLFNRFNNDPEVRKLSEHARRDRYDEFVKSVLITPTKWFLFRGGRHEYGVVNPRRLKELIDEKAPQEVIDQYAVEVTSALRTEYEESEIGPIGVESGIKDGFVVLKHEPSETYFRHTGERWEIGKIQSDDSIDWKRWTERRVRDLRSQYE